MVFRAPQHANAGIFGDVRVRGLGGHAIYAPSVLWCPGTRLPGLTLGGEAGCAGCLRMLMIAVGTRCTGPGSRFVRAGELGADLVGVEMLNVVKYG